LGEIASNKKLYNAVVAEKLKNYLLVLMKDPFFISNLAGIMNILNEKQK
jgi:hypothetical protein